MLATGQRPTLLEDLAGVVDAAAPERRWLVRPLFRPHPRHDLLLISRHADWRRDPPSLAALAELRADARVAELDDSGEDVLLRVADDALAALGACLEQDEPPAPPRSASAPRFAVHFWDPCTTKPLHVGHLRNLALGHALCAALEHGGAQVERRSTLADYGRSVAEAMVGFAHRFPDGPPAGEKGDHVVGRCYTEYVATIGGADGDDDEDGLDGPLAREVTLHRDEAETLLARLAAGDPAASGLSDAIRELVVAGQLATLARLGIAFDDVIPESDLLPTCAAVVERGLRERLFVRRDDGAVIYPTGRDDYPLLTLTRADGVPTQHLRCMTIWIHTEARLRETTSLQICGDEWAPHCVCTEPLLARLMAEGPSGVHPSRHLLHGMVTFQRAKVSSSEGTEHSVDGLLDWLAEEIAARTEPGEPVARPAALALGYFLSRPPHALMEFSPERLFDPRESPGWLFALARRRLARAEGADRGLEPEHRFAIVQSEVVRTHLRRVPETHEISDVTRTLVHFGRWCLDGARTPRVARLASALLERGEAALGLSAAA